MKIFLILSAVLVVALARPEPPRPRFPSQKFSAPQQTYAAPAQEYAAPQQEYGPPAQEYGPPAQEYGPPAPEQIITKNVYVHVPPEEPTEIIQSAPIEVAVPKKHYKIVFIKAPTPPTPTAPVIPVQPQDEHKTLVYVLVKKPDPQPDIVLPQPEATEPSKPEVYFIKYKQTEKEPSKQYGPPGRY